mmetsp:Transcript_41017/g.47166  ORF Transcript_41017/g.47166 Transcript_41017/m.47166 type:complete len:208 (-) Transcript_41017:953-1576(-)
MVCQTESLMLSLPEPNFFFPESHELLPADSESSESPKLILNEENCQIWYMKDDKFKTRYILASDYLYFKDTSFDVSVEGKVFIEIWTDVINLYLKEFLYTVKYATAEFDWVNMNAGFQFRFFCFRDKFEQFVCTCYKMLQKFKAKNQQQRFDAVREDKLKEANNFFFQDPKSQAWEYLDSMLYSKDYPKHLMLKALEELTFERFVEL